MRALADRFELVIAERTEALSMLRQADCPDLLISTDDNLLAEARSLRPSCRRVYLVSDACNTRELVTCLNRASAHRVVHGAASEADAEIIADLVAPTDKSHDLPRHRDVLTGLYNHSAFRERLHEEMARARRYGKPLSILYCDIDDFAKINSDLGYDIGDAVLRNLANVLTDQHSPARLRDSDIAARYGGEEVVVLLPETSKEGAAVKAERLRSVVQEAEFPGKRRIRISIGIAGFPDDAGTPGDLIRSAENALLAAKDSGRNCVRISAAGDDAAALKGPGLQKPERFTSYHVRLFDIVSSLKRDRSLSCLYVDLSQLRSVERELGPAQHADLYARAGDILENMRGDRLRHDDLICRTEDADGYLCFLAAPRHSGSHIDLEAIGARIEATLESELRGAMAAVSREMPRVVVGFARVLDNPMMRPERLVVRAVAESQRSATVHRERLTQRHKSMLQEVILRDMLTSVYQPIVDLTSGSTFGFEALARGPRDSTFESPIALFSVADQVDLTFELDRACFRTALAGAVGLEPVHRLFVNLLPTSFYDASFIESEVSNLLEAAALTPANVVFEITERLAIENFASFREALAGYTSVGFGVAIDDVGTRHSNLESVMALRPHFVKLSDVLTRGVSTSTVKREMVRSLQRIAEAIDAVIVAEGIETLEDLAVLCDLGVRYGQGYFLARPGPPFPRIRSTVRSAVRSVMQGAGKRRDSGLPAAVVVGEIDDEEPQPDVARAAGKRVSQRDDSDFNEPTRPNLPLIRSAPASSLPPPVVDGPGSELPELDGELGALGDLLGSPAGKTPLIASLRRRRTIDTNSDGFDEETTSGGNAN